MLTTATQEFVWAYFQTKKMIVTHLTLSLDWEVVIESSTLRVMGQHAVRQTTEKRISEAWDIFWSVKRSGSYQRYDSNHAHISTRILKLANHIA